MTISGGLLIVLGLLYVELPQIVRFSLFSIGALNLFLGIAELVPRQRVRLAATLRITAYLAFLAGLVLICVRLIATSG